MSDADHEQLHDSDSPPSESPSQWYVAGVFGAMGFEFVGFVVGGYFIGAFIDDHFGAAPVGILVMVLVGMVAAMWHIYRVAKRFLR